MTSSEYIVLWIIVGFYSVWVGWELRRWFAARAYFGSIPVWLIKRMFQFSLLTRRRWLLITCLLQAVLMTTLFIAYQTCVYLGIDLGPLQNRPMRLLIFGALTSMTPVLRHTCPPVVLFLSASGAAPGHLFANVCRSIAPLRCVALLDPARMSLASNMVVEADNLRTKMGSVWRSIVYELIEVVPAIVIDARSNSEFVSEEVFMVIASQREDKAIFVISEQGGAHALERQGINAARSELNFATDEMAPSVLAKILRASLRPKRDCDRRSLETQPVISGFWENKPAIAIASISSGFDSRGIIASSIAPRKPIVCLTMLPEAYVHESDRRIIEWSWHFAYNTHLGVLVIGMDEIVFVRKQILEGALATVKPVTVNVPNPLEIVDVDKPSPVFDAFHDFVLEVSALASTMGYSTRCVRISEDAVQRLLLMGVNLSQENSRSHESAQDLIARLIPLLSPESDGTQVGDHVERADLKAALLRARKQAPAFRKDIEYTLRRRGFHRFLFWWLDAGRPSAPQR